MPQHRRSLTFARAAAVLITVGIGVASFVLSFAALRDLAARAGIPYDLAWLWPLIVDGTILQATMAVVVLAGYRAQERNRRYFWIVLASSAAVSVGANALHAIIPGSAPLHPWLAAAIAVVAPVGLLAATHGLSVLIGVSDLDDAVEGIDEKLSTTTVFRVPAAPVHDDKPAVPPHADPPLPADVLQPWETIADVIATRDVVNDLAVQDVAGVLHLRYERELSQQAIGRQLGIDQRVVDEIVATSSELLRSGDVSVERLAV